MIVGYSTRAGVLLAVAVFAGIPIFLTTGCWERPAKIPMPTNNNTKVGF